MCETNQPIPNLSMAQGHSALGIMATRYAPWLLWGGRLIVLLNMVLACIVIFMSVKVSMSYALGAGGGAAHDQQNVLSVAQSALAQHNIIASTRMAAAFSFLAIGFAVFVFGIDSSFKLSANLQGGCGPCALGNPGKSSLHNRIVNQTRFT